MSTPIRGTGTGVARYDSAVVSEVILELVLWLLLAPFRLVGWAVGRIARPVRAWLRGPPPEGMPCPKCGYDCRGFDIRQRSHRCPECGTELRWGMPPGGRTRFVERG